MRWLGPILLIGWIFFVTASFFTIQKPFDAAAGVALLNNVLNLAVAGWLVVIALGLGSWGLDHLTPELSLVERVVFGISLGLGVLGLLGLLVGAFGLLQPWIAYAVTLGLTGLVILPLNRLYRRWQRATVTDLPNPLVALYLGWMALLMGLLALLPPTDWDGLFYHLTGPKLHLETGYLVQNVDIPHLSFPALMEMLFAWAMLLRGDIAAQLLHTVYAFLLAGLVYVTATRLFKLSSGWWAVLLLFSMPMIVTLGSWTYNDLALAFYQLASMYAIIVYAADSESKGGWLILSGLCAGFAMSLKYTSFITPLVVVGLIVWFDGWQSRRVGRMLINLTVFAVAAWLVAGAWYVRNWLFTGNPVYPFLYGVFGGQFWDSFRAEWYAAAGTGIGVDPLTLLGLPWLLTMGFRDMNYWDGRTGPILLIFLPLVIWWAIPRNNANRPVAFYPLLVYVVAQAAFWTLGVIWSRSLWQSRLLLPALIGVIPIVAWIWTQLPRLDLPQFAVSRFVSLTIALTLLLTAVDVGLLTLNTINPVPYLTGSESRDAYLTRRLGVHYAAMQEINQQLPADAVVLFLWEPRSYYCQRDCRPDSILDAFPHAVYRHQTAEAIAEAWARDGVTHVLIHRAGLNFVLSDTPAVVDTEVLTALETQYLRLVFDVAEAYQVYRLETNQ